MRSFLGDAVAWVVALVVIAALIIGGALIVHRIRSGVSGVTSDVRVVEIEGRRYVIVTTANGVAICPVPTSGMKP